MNKDSSSEEEAAPPTAMVPCVAPKTAAIEASSSQHVVARPTATMVPQLGRPEEEYEEAPPDCNVPDAISAESCDMREA